MKTWCDWQIAPAQSVQKSLVAPLEAMGAAQDLDIELTWSMLRRYIYVAVRAFNCCEKVVVWYCVALCVEFS